MAWLTEPGPVSAHARAVGNMAFPCYLVAGERSALVDGAISSAAPLLEEHFGPDKLAPAWVLLTHTHYDHVGGLGVLRRLLPGLQVAGSAAAAATLAKPRVREFVLRMNRQEEAMYGLRQVWGEREVPLAPEDLRVDRVLRDGERLELGAGVQVQALEAPGHTRCSMVYLVEPDRLLLGGEALGAYVSPDEVQAQSVSSFREYLASLERLAGLELEAIALPHHGVRTGADARSHIPVALETARRFRARVLELHGQGLAPTALAATLTGELRHGLSAMQPERAFQLNLEAMIRAVLEER
jgi:2-aminobenzoylacetyl-CoA thioesterase